MDGASQRTEEGRDVSRTISKIRRWHVVAGLCLIHGYRNGAELGVSTGRFTVYLCGLLHDMRMTCVDRWAVGEPSERELSETYTGWDHEGNYQRFKGFAAEHFPGRVKIIRTSTAEAAKIVPDGSLDFVFIDADHTYEGCIEDIRAWTPKVRKGGLICGHDLNWPTVYRAVRETGPASLASDNVWLRYAE